jgi:hypothetical protein
MDFRVVVTTIYKTKKRKFTGRGTNNRMVSAKPVKTIEAKINGLTRINESTESSFAKVLTSIFQL